MSAKTACELINALRTEHYGTAPTHHWGSCHFPPAPAGPSAGSGLKVGDKVRIINAEPKFLHCTICGNSVLAGKGIWVERLHCCTVPCSEKAKFSRHGYPAPAKSASEAGFRVGQRVRVKWYRAHIPHALYGAEGVVEKAPPGKRIMVQFKGDNAALGFDAEDLEPLPTPDALPQPASAAGETSAPIWTIAHVANLMRRQRTNLHPYTCGNNHEGSRDLVPTPDGWRCPGCDYTQGWAHAQDIDGTFPDMQNPFREMEKEKADATGFARGRAEGFAEGTKAQRECDIAFMQGIESAARGLGDIAEADHHAYMISSLASYYIRKPQPAAAAGSAEGSEVAGNA